MQTLFIWLLPKSLNYSDLVSFIFLKHIDAKINMSGLAVFYPFPCPYNSNAESGECRP